MSASGLGGGGKRNVNIELNLVPFIDLFSTLICFLLLTAAYQELEAVRAGAPPIAAPSDQPKENQPPPEKKAELSVSLLIDRVEAAENDMVVRMPHAGTEPDYERLKALLVTWHEKYPDRKDVTLNTDSRAPYKQLIGLMDAMISGHFPDVGINLN